jgi:type IV pilus modification protein PilV
MKRGTRNAERGTRNKAGFSLVEVMCAILILGVGLVGLTQGITAALKSSKESELQTTAALLAAAQIETLRADGFVIDGESDGDGEGDLSLYHWKQSVTSTRVEGLHEVEVVVENANTGKTIYELRTLLFDPPLSSALDESMGRKDSGRKREGRGR